MILKTVLVVGMAFFASAPLSMSEGRSLPNRRVSQIQPAQSTNDSSGKSLKPDDSISTVGFPKLIYQHVIPGSRVIAKPIVNRKQPILIRIVDEYPHGSDFRYDIEYRGLDPGRYNLADYLVRDDGSNVPIPPIPVEVNSLLGEGQVVPTALPAITSRFRNYYTPILIGLGGVWLIGLVTILFYGRKRRMQIEAAEKPLTVADRLRPLIDLAESGALDPQQSAELERVLSAFWCKKLGLHELSANDLRVHLRGHPEASVMLIQIDAWLHRPSTDSETPVDINQLLQPYRSMSYEEI